MTETGKTLSGEELLLAKHRIENIRVMIARMRSIPDPEAQLDKRED